MKKAIIRISGELLVEMFRDGGMRKYSVENGLPEDARFIGAESSYDGKTADLVFESDSFADVIEGNDPPLVRPVLGIEN